MMDITIVVPVYNRKELVLRTLESIPAEYNLIIVDNGSTDGSYELCRQWALNTRRKNVKVEREFKPGAAAARNMGLALCSTRWVYFFDSDDEFTGIPQEWNENADMVCFPTVQVTNGKGRVRDYFPVATPHTQVLSLMLNTIAVIYDTRWLKSIGGWNDKCLVWDDWELGVRALLKQPRVQWITSKAYHHIIIHEESLTGGSWKNGSERLLTTLSIVFDDIYEIGKGNTRKKALFALFLRCYLICGHLLKAGNRQAADDVEHFIYERFSVNKQSYKVGKLFRWYTAKGGRGAWKIALRLVDSYNQC